MDITRQKTGRQLTLHLSGRLDANWCGHLEDALASAVRDGEHHILLDMLEIGYISSAGLRVLLSFYKQLRSIDGHFGIVRGSVAVRDVIELAGLGMLLATETDAEAPNPELGETRTSPCASFELFRQETHPPILSLSLIGEGGALQHTGTPTAVPSTKFGPNTFALGIGALGGTYADSEPRFGEFLAAAGAAAFQPSDDSSRPDFAVCQASFVPGGHLLSGLLGEGSFPLLARFEATADAQTVGLTELATTALEFSNASAAAFVAITETAGLVGASLLRSPTQPETGDRFAFPGIRDWLSFTSERAFRDSTSLLTGVVARPGSPFDPLLRPLGTHSDLRAHVHAAAFPYRPLRKGRVELHPTVNELFEGSSLQAVLHLLADPREFNGAGDSAFTRGALWIAPVEPHASAKN